MSTEVCEGVAGVGTYEPYVTDSPEYRRQHAFVNSTFGPALDYDCIQCESQAGQWAWQHGQDPSLLGSYEAMCCACHVLYDGLRERMMGNTYTLGHTLTDEHKAKIGASGKGRITSDQSRINYSLSKRGENNAIAKLTESDIPVIRAMYADGHSAQQIAEFFGVSKQSAWEAATYKTWRHV